MRADNWTIMIQSNGLMELNFMTYKQAVISTLF